MGHAFPEPPRLPHPGLVPRQAGCDAEKRERGDARGGGNLLLHHPQPSAAFYLRGFARGVYAKLLTLILAPHVVLLVFLAVSAVYPGLEMRLIEGMPFSRQPETSINLFIVPMMMRRGVAIAIAVGLQYFLIFRSPLAVLPATVGLLGCAWFLTRSSLEAFEAAIRFRLRMLSNESKGFYTEVDG